MIQIWYKSAADALRLLWQIRVKLPSPRSYQLLGEPDRRPRRLHALTFSSADGSSGGDSLLLCMAPLSHEEEEEEEVGSSFFFSSASHFY